ncbi:hypothetical protein [Sphingosinicella terrae]|uniref:hypothetical protein n=1 Tax=Sphingosinicella terrae TaxID=2172047 RepID=UPI000E0CEB0D|nr:hypothetical protein [Sphingosinicella terrae]
MIGFALLLLAQAGPPPPPPLHGGPATMTCPVGGESFEALQSSHYSTTGRRPDGRPHSYWYMPLPIPECPSNGLVVFRDFSPEEVGTLESLIASDAYRAMVADDSTYYRAQWLATRLGLPEKEALGLLLAATWQVKPEDGPTGQPLPSPERARRYQEEFVRRVMALPADPQDAEYVGLHARAANAQRELGRFDEAAAMLRQIVGWSSAGDQSGWSRFAEQLLPAVERQDGAVEPLDLADEVRLPWLCMDEDRPQSAYDRTLCGRPDVQARIAENLRRREQAAQRESAAPASSEDQ